MVHIFNLLFLDIGGPELMLIMVVVLLLFGGQKLPELARGLGKGIREFKDASSGVKRDFEDSINKFNEEKDHPQPEDPIDSYRGLPTSVKEENQEHPSDHSGKINTNS